MTVIHNAFVNAILADAAYVADLGPGLTSDDLMAKLKDRMTPVIAQYIADNFTVVTQIESIGSSFDATVWKDKTGKLYVSMRGTQQGVDFLVDGDLALTGNARAQLMDMVNWWLRETTPLGQSARQIQWSPFTEKYQEIQPALGTGRIPAADLVNGIEVNGHSLGGYLASAFTRLFGAQAHVQHTTTFNSAGFAPGSETAFQQLQNLIGVGYGIGHFPTTAEQTNYFAGNGINVTTNSFWFSQVGQRIELSNEESGNQIDNHFMYKLTDVLALAEQLNKLDPSLDFPRLNKMLEAAGSDQTTASLEPVLDGFRRIFLGNAITATMVGDIDGSASSRLSYHNNLDALKSSTNFQALQGKVTIEDIPADGLAAKTDFGTLMSLYYGLPFVLQGQGIDSIWQTTQANLYAQWQADKALPADDQGKRNFSDQWLEDRARYIEALAEANTADSGNAASFDQDTWIITDKAINRTLTLMPIGASGTDPNGNPIGGSNNSAQVNQLYFGSDSADTVTASDGDYHLYGGGGAICAANQCIYQEAA